MLPEQRDKMTLDEKRAVCWGHLRERRDNICRIADDLRNGSLIADKDVKIILMVLHTVLGDLYAEQ